MNILALVTDAFGSSGGIAQYNRDLVKALASCPGQGRVVIIPRLGGCDPAALPPRMRQLRPRRSQIAYSFAAFAAARALGPFDLVFCGHLHLSPLAAVLARRLGIPLWLQLHGWEAWERPSRPVCWAAEHAKLITAVSRYTRRRFLSLTGVDPLRVKVLPNTVAASFFPGEKSGELLDRYGLRGRTILLTVGRLDAHERRKGHDKIIRALPEIMKTFPDLAYLIVGEGDDRHRLEALARNVGVDSAVHLVGAVDADELPRFYRLADVYVMPSTQEGFGIVFLEAAASGVRTIGGDADGSMDALADGALGAVIDPDDPVALVNAIKDALHGCSPCSAGVRRFAFDHFMAHVRDLVAQSLLPHTARASP